MRKILFLLARSYRLHSSFIGGVLLSVISFGQKAPLYDYKSDNYLQVFGSKYIDACSYFATNSWISDTLKSYKVDPAIAVAIVFPELIRYSALSDKFETGALLTLYVQYGQKYADFSIGHFQMKPTFAKQLETDLQKLPAEEKNCCFRFDVNETEKARLERVKRLDSPIWQVRYLIYFIKIMDSKYASKFWTTTSEKLTFYATAYNCGYTLPEPKIREKLQSKLFYTSLLKGNICYSYSAIAVDFYQSLFKALSR